MTNSRLEYGSSILNTTDLREEIPAFHQWPNTKLSENKQGAMLEDWSTAVIPILCLTVCCCGGGQIPTWVIIYLRKLCPQQQSRKGLLSTPEASERESDLEEWGPVTSEPSVTQIEPQIPEVNTKPKRFKTWILSNRPFERYQYFILM